MSLLSSEEVSQLKQSAQSPVYQTFRNCALAVLNSGAVTDNTQEVLERYKDFDIEVIQRGRGVKLVLSNPPEAAFVDGELIVGINDQLFSVLRDILFVRTKYERLLTENLTGDAATNFIFEILRNADAVRSNTPPNLVVCWGGHSIGQEEYEYTKDVGYQMGLRGVDICTGCGPGAMKGPMKGATIGHAKQRISSGRYIGLTEPGIIAAEAPNPIVNKLVILPDIEKRLEAFLRIAHAVVIFPGGAGTAEELLYLLRVMLDPENKTQQLPIILTGPESAKNYFDVLDTFIEETLGKEAQHCYQIILDDPVAVAKTIKAGLEKVEQYRGAIADAFHFNWTLHVEDSLQLPFDPTHENMHNLDLSSDQGVGELAANLRRAFSGIVAGNVKPDAMAAIDQLGPFQLKGDPQLMKKLDHLLKQFVDQGRMKLPGSVYEPCYEISNV